LAVAIAPQLIGNGGVVEDLPRDEHYFDYVILETKLDMMDSAGEYDVWGLGDSSCLFGFAPAAFDSASGMRSVNFGTFGFVGLESHLRLLKELLQRNQAPEAILVWLHPHTLARSTPENEATGYPQWFQERLDAGGGIDLTLLEKANDFYGGTLRLSLLDHAGWGRPMLGEQLTPQDVRERVARHRGWFPSEPMEEAKYYGCYELHPDASLGLTRFGELCRERGIPVYLYVMPILEHGPCDEAYLAEMEREILKSLGTGMLISDVPRVVSWPRMQSPTHFARSLARTMSDRVGARLRALMEIP